MLSINCGILSLRLHHTCFSLVSNCLCTILAEILNESGFEHIPSLLTHFVNLLSFINIHFLDRIILTVLLVEASTFVVVSLSKSFSVMRCHENITSKCFFPSTAVLFYFVSVSLSNISCLDSNINIKIFIRILCAGFHSSMDDPITLCK